MSESEFKKLFAKNLTYYINSSGKSQAEVARALHLNKATLSSWCTGIRTPRMDKVDALCSYFGIRRSDLMEDHLSRPESSILPLTQEEQSIIHRYRVVDDSTKSAVCAVLGVERQEEGLYGLEIDA